MNSGKRELHYPDHLVVLLDQATDRIRGDVAARVDWSNLGALRPWHLQILFILPEDGARPSDLAAAAGMSRQALSQWVRELAADDYVVVTVEAADRRNRIVRPTSRALDAITQATTAIADVEAAWAGELGAERFDAFRHTLLDLRDRRAAS